VIPSFHLRLKLKPRRLEIVTGWGVIWDFVAEFSAILRARLLIGGVKSENIEGVLKNGPVNTVLGSILGLFLGCFLVLHAFFSLLLLLCWRLFWNAGLIPLCPVYFYLQAFDVDVFEALQRQVCLDCIAWFEYVALQLKYELLNGLVSLYLIFQLRSNEADDRILLRRRCLLFIFFGVL